MTEQFAVPAVGSKIKAVVRMSEPSLFAKSKWRDLVFEGTVVPNDKWTRPNAFNMTGNKDWPIREVGVADIIELQFLDGSTAKKVAVDNEVKTMVVAGSKPGVTYTVTKVGSKKTCNCPGFTFKKKCKHTEMI